MKITRAIASLMLAGTVFVSGCLADPPGGKSSGGGYTTSALTCSTDSNGDGQVTCADTACSSDPVCVGAGVDGTDGLSCWDLDMDGVNDPEEDINSDGQFTTLDCQGPAGTSCSVVQNTNGSATITCEDGTSATIDSPNDGIDGTSCTVVDSGNCATITCEDNTSATVCDGEDGQDGSSCSVVQNTNGSATITCEDGTSATIDSPNDGIDGTSCTVVDSGNCATITCEDGTNATVCDGTTTPGTEICDGVDNDGDGQIDEGVKNTYYQDGDGDTYGDPDVTIQACTAPTGYVADNTDCDPQGSGNHPGAFEWCDSFDNDCDGITDNAAGSTTSGTACTTTMTDKGGNYECTRLADAVSATWLSTHTKPDQLMVTSTVLWLTSKVSFSQLSVLDMDGNHQVDDEWSCEEISDNWEDTKDRDGDGYSVATGDCDENGAGNNPKAPEICGDGYDNNCNGAVDEDCNTDGDGDGQSDLQGDCNDQAKYIYTGAQEWSSNGVDDDCDGKVDEVTP